MTDTRTAAGDDGLRAEIERRLKETALLEYGNDTLIQVEFAAPVCEAVVMEERRRWGHAAGCFCRIDLGCHEHYGGLCERDPRCAPQPTRAERARCQHKSFKAKVEVNRLVDSGRFSADLQVECADCGEPFIFRGLKCGLDLDGAAVSVDGKTARLAIWPSSMEPHPLAGMRGFTVEDKTNG